MPQLPRPIFESYEIFIDQDFSSPEPGMVCVRVYLDSFQPEVEAHKGYLAARSFLRSFSDNSFTFTNRLRCLLLKHLSIFLWLSIQSAHSVPLSARRRNMPHSEAHQWSFIFDWNLDGDWHLNLFPARLQRVARAIA